MTRALIAHGCRVTAIERDAESGRAARQVCDRVLIADVEEMDFEQALGKELYDIILLGDVLEHLVQPEKLLGTLRRFVMPNGSLVVSLPNVAHASVRLALLGGRFEYRPWGLLDATHLRFFTRASMRAMFERSGWVISDVKDIEIQPLDWEVEWDPLEITSSVLRRLSRDADAFTYQFVFRAVPQGRRALNEPRNPADEMRRAAWNVQRVRRQLAQFLVRRAVRRRRGGGETRAAIALLWKAFLLSSQLKTLGWLVVVSLPPRVCNRIDKGMGGGGVRGRAVDGVRQQTERGSPEDRK